MDLLTDFVEAFKTSTKKTIGAVKRFIMKGPASTAVLLFTLLAMVAGGYEILVKVVALNSPVTASVAAGLSPLLFGALFLGLGVPLLSSAIVSVREHRPDHHGPSDDRYHVAMAWSSGVMGTILLIIEVLGISEFRFEDLLLAASGVNMLVRELSRRSGPSPAPVNP